MTTSTPPFDPANLAQITAWAAIGLGAGLWAWGWLGEKHPIRKMRFHDCGMVLLFSAILLRYLLMERAMTPIDWGVAILAPVFIAGALWRLSRTSGHEGGEP